MKVLFYTRDQNLSDSFTNELILMGIWLKNLSDLEQLNQLIENQKYHCIILDIDDKSVDWLFLIHSLRSSNGINKETQVVLLSSSSNQEYLEPFLTENINAIFDKKQSLTQYLSNLRSIFLLLENELPAEEKRRYTRIQPAEKEQIWLSIDLAGKNTSYKAKVRDISVIATAALMEKKDLLELVKEGQEIENIQFSINKKTVFTKGIALRVAIDPKDQNHILVFSYYNPNANFQKILVQYIYHKMQEEDSKEAPFTSDNK